ncbi:hypothetical protein EN827_27770 [Mesorhizobium sp. M1D.F.Ca.ET.184.01.1.1]|nr:hypothetical protein EN874_020495 [Mesorhizobium sp. M1D.F.Ca.ET.231.01.1.1]TGP26048.1 hypothetical protein EN877_27660 [Mesorhizobium sp. M1D.F.Ca.ET.234.01.1.1]TGS40116.1 hypothetical protein EN827_27770 [Mesorhizobium sp. M1D.F.Ca.ET.184.01.1.1]TGS58890.1 hypothetical protein EN826_027770 [Mesorhizobium sp. M1D.F.Ca.ET.183.01.1.1]
MRGFPGKAGVSLRWNTPHPSRRCAPIHLLPQGEKERSPPLPLQAASFRKRAPIDQRRLSHGRQIGKDESAAAARVCRPRRRRHPRRREDDGDHPLGL